MQPVTAKKGYVMPDSFHDLVHAIGRTFYEEKYIIILDMLVEEGLMRDDTIASRLHMNLRDANKFVLKLKEDRLVQYEAKADPKVHEMLKPVSHYYFYIDGYRFIHVCKYKMFEMRSRLESDIGSEEQQGYICPRCNHAYTALDLNNLLDPFTGQVLCEHCKVELQPEEKPSSFQDSRDKFVQFMGHTAHIVQLLQTMDQLVLPDFDPKEWLDEAAQVALRAATLAQVSQAIENPEQSRDSPVPNIQITMDTTLSQSQKSEASSAAQLPHWHAHSTVTGQQIVSFPDQLKRVNSPQPLPRPVTLPMATPQVKQPQRSTKQQTVLSTATITVQGKNISVNNVTEADIERMTPEEYEEYYEQLQKSNK